MMLLNKNKLNIIFLFSILILSFFSIPTTAITNKIRAPISADWGSNADWYEGTAQSTTEVDISYEEFTKIDESSGMDMLEQTMWIHYNDGTLSDGALIGRISFNEGGIVGGVVNDWTKMSGSGISFQTASQRANLSIMSEYNFNGFGVYKGNSTSLNLVNNTYVDSSGWAMKLNETKKIGEIEIHSKNYKIGQVTLGTNNVPFNGGSTTETIIEFDVFINGTIENSTHEQDIQVIYKFEVRHTINETRYKYGIDLDWTGFEDFPTDLNMNYGDDYFLVAMDRLGVSGADDSEFYLATFSCNPENDTAIFSHKGEEICRQHFTTAYKINFTGVDINTRRLYLPIGNEDVFGNYHSQVFVFFDGLKYGQSKGLSFDPTVIMPSFFTPTSDDDDNIISFGNLFLGFSIISIIALAIIVERRKLTM
ncbi:MAG: hypothetical protein ACXADW_19500 [Candidatus Hodarchaeales archaeon]